MNIKKNLENLINKKKAIVGVIGLGYVGLPLVNNLCNKKFKVYGFDNDKKKIQILKNKKSYLSSIDNKQIEKILSKEFFPKTNFKEIFDVDIIILCLPTPLNKSNNPNLNFVKIALKNIKKFLRRGQLIILESSTYPGCTRELILPILDSKKFKVGIDFFVGYSPEREDPSNKKFTIKNIPKICSGITSNCTEVTKKFYSRIVNQTIEVSNIETAEFTKIFENLYRSVNIALVNEMKIICRKLKLNINEVIEAAKSKPFGFKAFYPGPGVGGHCIPVDPFYLSWLAKKNKINLKFVELSGKINNFIPRWIISNSLEKKHKKILLVGAAYKKNVDDPRESPIFDFINILKKKQRLVDYHDPFIKRLASRKIKNIFFSKDISSKMLLKYDLVYILTDHEIVDYNLIHKYSKKIVDTRNVYKNTNSNKIVSL
jgi:UDP-N-acetyl-D-glucosamine dehydrogenase